jgi:hypothetical protein
MPQVTGTGTTSLSVGLKYRRRDQGSDWIGHWEHPDVAIPVFLPGKTVANLPVTILPGRRHAVADMNALDDRYSGLFAYFERTVTNAQYGAPAAGPVTNVKHRSQVRYDIFIMAVMNNSCVLFMKYYWCHMKH